MTQTRTLKLSILADIDQLTKGLTNGAKDVQTFGDKISDYGTKAAAAFAAATAAAVAYAGKLAVDSVKAAIVDEAAQRNLATTLENVTGATQSQIKAVEDYISVTALRTGIEDDQLRPAIARLIRSTEDATKAQDLLNLALDISAGTSKPLETVVNALGKAYDGQTQSLGRLGLGIDAAVLKSGDFEAITAALQVRFKGFAEQEADTFEGKMRRISLAFDEAKESLGAQLLPIIQEFADYILTTVVPAVQKWIDQNGPKLVETIRTVVLPAITELVNALAKIVEWVINNRETLATIGATIIAGLAAAKVTSTVTTIVTSLAGLAAAYTSVATAATTAGTATTNAAAAASTAAAASAGFATLLTRVAGVTAGLTALAAQTGVFDRLIDAAERLPGIGIRANEGNTKTVIPSQSFERGGLGAFQATQQAPVVVVPTVPNPAVDAAKQAAIDKDDTKTILDVTKSQIAATQASLDILLAQIGEAKQTVINVTGTVLDPQGVARAVDQVLKDTANATGSFRTLGIAPTSLNYTLA